MTDSDVAKILAIIRAAYPGWQKGGEQAAFAVWRRGLDGIDPNAAAKALDEHIKQSKYPPTVADIRAGATPERKIFARPAPVFKAVARKELTDGRDKKRLLREPAGKSADQPDREKPDHKD